MFHRLFSGTVVDAVGNKLSLEGDVPRCNFVCGLTRIKYLV